jgi:hypothetical protein
MENEKPVDIHVITYEGERYLSKTDLISYLKRCASQLKNTNNRWVVEELLGVLQNEQ